MKSQQSNTTTHVKRFSWSKPFQTKRMRIHHKSVSVLGWLSLRRRLALCEACLSMWSRERAPATLVIHTAFKFPPAGGFQSYLLSKASCMSSYCSGFAPHACCCLNSCALLKLFKWMQGMSSHSSLELSFLSAMPSIHELGDIWTDRPRFVAIARYYIPPSSLNHFSPN